MERRSVRQLALAAIPVMVLAQCAPQCAPPGTLTPIYTTVLANPEPVQWTANADGRYIGIGDPTRRVDVDTLATIGTPINGILSGDAQSVVGFRTPTELVRFDVASGVVEPLPAMPFGWTFNDIDGTSSDGRTVVAESDSASATGIFVHDAGAAEWRQIGVTGSGGPCDFNSCFAAVMSDGGTTVAFDVADENPPQQVWAVTASGATLVSATAAGEPGNADSVALDVTPDGRYVLFLSNATDLQGGEGSPDGRLYIRDLQAGTTTMLPLLVDNQARASLSADAQRVAYAAPATLPSSGGAVLTDVAAVFDRTTGKVTKLLPTGTAADVVWLGPIQISDNGLRVLWNRGDPNLGQLVLERVDFIGG